MPSTSSSPIFCHRIAHDYKVRLQHLKELVMASMTYSLFTKKLLMQKEPSDVPNEKKNYSEIFQAKPSVTIIASCLQPRHASSLPSHFQSRRFDCRVLFEPGDFTENLISNDENRYVHTFRSALQSFCKVILFLSF